MSRRSVTCPAFGVHYSAPPPPPPHALWDTHTPGTLRHSAEVQRNVQRAKRFGDMSRASFAAMAHGVPSFTAPQVP